jgi:hypothetical protein
VEKLVSAAMSIALGVLDVYLDSQIDRLKDDELKQTLRNVEDEVMRLLGGPLGQAIGRYIAVRASARWMPNDPSTGTWG